MFKIFLFNDCRENYNESKVKDVLNNNIKN